MLPATTSSASMIGVTMDFASMSTLFNPVISPVMSKSLTVVLPVTSRLSVTVSLDLMLVTSPTLATTLFAITFGALMVSLSRTTSAWTPSPGSLTSIFSRATRRVEVRLTVPASVIVA